MKDPSSSHGERKKRNHRLQNWRRRVEVEISQWHLRRVEEKLNYWSPTLKLPSLPLKKVERKRNSKQIMNNSNNDENDDNKKKKARGSKKLHSDSSILKKIKYHEFEREREIYTQRLTTKNITISSLLLSLNFNFTVEILKYSILHLQLFNINICCCCCFFLYLFLFTRSRLLESRFFSLLFSSHVHVCVCVCLLKKTF